MFLQSVSIKNFRSIHAVTLNGCTGLNVLIGKNNAGKSNILSAINAAFSYMKGGRIVLPRPPLAQELNFNRRDEPIEIGLDLSLSLAERDALLRDIASEAPHMKNAVDGLDPSLWLIVKITIVPPPHSYAVVSKLALAHVTEAGTKGEELERVILNVDTKAAIELNNKASRSAQLSRDAKALRGGMDRLLMVMRRRTEREEPIPVEYIFRSMEEVSPETLKKVEGAINSARPDTWESDVKAFVANLENETEELLHKPIKSKIQTFSGEETEVPKYVSTLLERLGSIKVLYIQERRKSIGKEEAQQLLELKMSRGGPEVLRRIQETVAALLGVQIDAFRGDSKSPRSEAEAELDVDNFLVQVNGSGVRESLRLILDVEFQKPNILLVEEPELHLHPALEASIMRYLQATSALYQVFLTTHSTNFLDSAELSNIYLVTKDNASTEVQLVNVAEAEALIPRELGLRMSSLFMYERLVFVEGSTDEGILREWAATLTVNLSQANVGFVRMGGARNFSYYSAAATLSFLSKRRVQSWILLDRDERDDQEIKRFQETAKGFATVKILEQQEIENLLLIPRAIGELIRLKARNTSNTKTGLEHIEEKVSIALDEVVEGLKRIAISKRVSKKLCVPVYPRPEVHEITEGEEIQTKVGVEIDRLIASLQERKLRISDVYQGTVDNVEQSWTEQRLQLVPGELILDGVLQRFGFRFNKDHDGPRLASLMLEHEIPSTMKALVREFGAS